MSNFTSKLCLFGQAQIRFKIAESVHFTVRQMSFGIYERFQYLKNCFLGFSMEKNRIVHASSATLTFWSVQESIWRDLGKDQIPPDTSINPSNLGLHRLVPPCWDRVQVDRSTRDFWVRKSQERGLWWLNMTTGKNILAYIQTRDFLLE